MISKYFRHNSTYKKSLPIKYCLKKAKAHGDEPYDLDNIELLGEPEEADEIRCNPIEQHQDSQLTRVLREVEG
jgi:hypothetical protein